MRTSALPLNRRVRISKISRGNFPSGNPLLRATVFVAFASVTVATTSTLLAFDPLTALVASMSVPLLVGIVSQPRLRLATVVIGALLVFQSNADTPKYAYLALSVICVLASAVNLTVQRRTVMAPFKPLIIASMVLLAYLVLSSLIAIGNGTTPTNWFRDVLPYFLMGLLPIVGLDAASYLRQDRFEVVIYLLGIVGSIGVALDWTERRGVSALNIGRVILSTFALVSLGFSVATVRAGLGPKRILWYVGLCGMTVAMLITGTRTNLVLLMAFPAVLGSPKNARVRPLRLVTMTAASLAGVLFLIGAVSSIALAQQGFLTARLNALLAAINGGSAADLSYSARLTQYDWAWTAFQNHLVVGTGPGYLYPSGGFGLDAATIILAKWGLLGTAVLLMFLASAVMSVRRAKKVTGPRPIHTAAFAWMIVLLCLLPLGPWLEDKGFSIALTLLIAAVAAHTNGGQACQRAKFMPLANAGSHRRTLRDSAAITEAEGGGGPTPESAGDLLGRMRGR